MQTRLTDIEKPFNIMFFILFSSLTKMIFMYAWECLVLSPVAGSCLAHSLLVQSLVASLPGSFTFIVTHKKYAGPHRAEERGGKGGGGKAGVGKAIYSPQYYSPQNTYPLSRSSHLLYGATGYSIFLHYQKSCWCVSVAILFHSAN